MANLIREPQNQYDANAIRVDNLSHEQVGHIKRTYAAVLAPIIDDPSPAAPRAEVTIPREPTNVYEVSGELKLLGLPQHAEAAIAALRVGGFALVGGYAAQLVAERAAQAQAAAQAARDAARAQQQQQLSLAQQPFVQPLQVVRMDAASCERELDVCGPPRTSTTPLRSADRAPRARPRP